MRKIVYWDALTYIFYKQCDLIKDVRQCFVFWGKDYPIFLNSFTVCSYYALYIISLVTPVSLIGRRGGFLSFLSNIFST